MIDSQATFAGARTNEPLASHLFPAQPGDLSISFPAGTTLIELERLLDELRADAVAEDASFDDDAVEALKFHECLPALLCQEVLRRRLVNQTVLGDVLARRTDTVLVSG